MSNQNPHLRRRSAVNHYRRRLLAPLKEILNRTQFEGSLQTADPALARRLARKVSVALDQLAETLQRMSADRQPTPGQLNLVLKEILDKHWQIKRRAPTMFRDRSLRPQVLATPQARQFGNV